MRTVTTHSVAETEAAAAELAQTLRGGECVALEGEMGAGKTQFVRGLVRGLAGNGRAVSSPTFVLLNVYDAQPIRLPVFHLDAYRVGGPDDSRQSASLSWSRKAVWSWSSGRSGSSR